MTMKLLVIFVLLACVGGGTCGTVSCSYYCTRSERYTTSCGWFGWSRCTRYRAVGATCYRTGVNGEWSTWSTSGIGTCSVTCGPGTRLRTYVRYCNNPAPSDCGATCAGSNTRSEYEACNNGCCPVSGGWSSWQLRSVSSCPVTCGGGTQSVTYQRSCSNPSPSCGGATCPGSSTNVVQQTCSTQNCPVDGGWSSWSVQDNGSCSVTCGGGTLSVTYQRKCNNPEPQYGGQNCTGDVTKVESASCNPQPCPVDGGWSSWILETNSSCSVTCGRGEMNVTYRRHCDDPAPQYGGSDCTGDATRVDTVPCNTQPCPIDGGWSPWYLDNNGSCSVPCGGGQQNLTYIRYCNDPNPQYGGGDCVGDNIRLDTVECNTQPCPIDGGWSSWEVKNNGSCSVTCGGGEMDVTYTRNCSSPTPQYGGGDCEGDDSRTEQVSCNTHPCPIDGGWSDWEEWRNIGECSALCGGGQVPQLRQRWCDDPQPAYGGSECEGAAQQNQTVGCNDGVCGDRCPEGNITFIPNANNSHLYYQCDNNVAVLKRCGVGSVWDQPTNTCIHDTSQQKTECDPSRVYQPHPTDCSKFIMCVQGTAFQMSCPPGTRYIAAIGACDFATDGSC